jgi:hypothetical protein
MHCTRRTLLPAFSRYLADKTRPLSPTMAMPLFSLKEDVDEAATVDCCDAMMMMMESLFVLCLFVCLFVLWLCVCRKMLCCSDE